MAKTLIPSTLLLCLIAGASCWSLAPRAVAADNMEWQFYESDDPDNKGSMTARLVYGVPETDNVQVTGICDATRGTGVPSSSVTFGAEIGDLENGKEVELRVSGGGFDHPLKGQIYRSTGEEGLSGVQVDIKHDDPLWAEMDEKESLDYLVPGYRAATLDFTRGRNKIKQFVQACRTYAAAPSGEPVDAEAKETGENAEKEAFESAKELGTVEAWEAFVASYPAGFRADLARAYIKALDSDEPVDGDVSDSDSYDGDSYDSETVGGAIDRGSGAKAPVKPAPAKPVVKRTTGCEEGFKLVKGKCQRLTQKDAPQGCPAGTKPVPETDNCVPIANAPPVVKKAVPVVKKVTGCEEGFKLVKGKCKRIAAAAKPQGCPPGTKPVPETDNCVPIGSANKVELKPGGCAKGQVRIEGRCIAKQDAASFCGPGYRLKGNKCVQGYAEPKKQKQLPTWQLQAIAKGCRPGQGWNAQEGCHEND